MSRIFRGALATLSIVLLSSAVLAQPTGPNQDVQLDKPFELQVGRTAVVTTAGITVKFVRVVSDSRCPTGVQCVWAGVASVEVALRKPPAPEASRILQSNLPVEEATSFEGFRITLVEVKPYPREGVAVAPSDHRIVLRIDREKSGGGRDLATPERP